ncbi:spore germination protein [Dethiothermospora halolimnae]|uniref:spore germination protein n=1 Tax=Dethiothermospora halolimnae TaxID=3114390 RepID=UPI003CCBC435
MNILKKKNRILNRIKEYTQGNSSITMRKINIKNNEIYLFYIGAITDRNRVSGDIIKPILQYNERGKLTIDKIARSVIYIDDIIFLKDEDNIIDYIFKGNSVIFMPSEDKYIVCNTLKVEKRNVTTPEIQTTLRGPRDAFIENLETNLSLIRYRIKHRSLQIDKYVVGTRTKTSVAMIYIKDIVNETYVAEIKKRLEKIDVDGIMDSGNIEKFIGEDRLQLFPQIGIIERPDSACSDMLKGKVCLMIEGSNLALIMPQTFFSFLDSGDDHYGNTFLSVFNKSMRLLSVFITTSFSAIYVGLVSFHPDILPPQYALALASSRTTVPVNALLEALLMEFVADMLKEASVRLPKQIGPAIGIVGTIVIGQAAVTAGLVSPLMVIIVSLTTMTSFIAPDFSIINPFKIVKFGLILITGTFGLFGFIIGITIIMLKLTSMDMMGVPYMEFVSPFSFREVKNYFLSNLKFLNKRPGYLKTKDDNRQ